MGLFDHKCKRCERHYNRFLSISVLRNWFEGICMSKCQIMTLSPPTILLSNIHSLRHFKCYPRALSIPLMEMVGMEALSHRCSNSSSTGLTMSGTGILTFPLCKVSVCLLRWSLFKTSPLVGRKFCGRGAEDPDTWFSFDRKELAMFLLCTVAQNWYWMYQTKEKVLRH